MRILLWAPACLLLALPAAGAVPAVDWTTGEDGSMAAPEGHAWVKWAPRSEAPIDTYVFERISPDDGERAVRRIADTATFIAGLPEGTTELRVRAVADGAEGPWSETLHVEVSYPSLAKVRFLAALGSLLLVATVALIITGHRRSKAETEAAARPSESEVGADG